MKRYLKIITLGLLICGATGFRFGHNFQRMSANVLIRKVQDGYKTRIKGTLYYSVTGKMVTYFTEPSEIVILNNSKGEVTIYDKNSNTVIQDQNVSYSSKTNELYYFLTNKQQSLGLDEAGFTLENTSFDDDLMVTTWKAPMEMSKYFSTIKLVHRQENPIFAEYKDGEGKVVKKVYFYDYQYINGYNFPLSVTQIDYKSANDSIMSKTTFSDFKFNDEVADDFMNYQVPASAKPMK